MTEKDRFEVVAPSGQRRTIIEWQHYTDTRPMNGASRRLPGGTEFLTSDGMDASRKSDGTFITFDSEEVFMRV